MVSQATRRTIIDHSVGPYDIVPGADTKYVGSGRTRLRQNGDDEVPLSAILDSQESSSSSGSFDLPLLTDQALHEVNAPPKLQLTSRMVVGSSQNTNKNEITPNKINKFNNSRQGTPSKDYIPPNNVRSETTSRLKNTRDHNISGQERKSLKHDNHNTKHSTDNRKNMGKSKRKEKSRRDFRRSPHLQEALDRIKDRRAEEQRPRLQTAMGRRISPVDEMQERQSQHYQQHGVGEQSSTGNHSDRMFSSASSHSLEQEIDDIGKLRETVDIFGEYETILQHLFRKHSKLKAIVDGDTDSALREFSLASEDVKLKLQRLRESQRTDEKSKNRVSRLRNNHHGKNEDDWTKEGRESKVQRNANNAPITAKLFEGVNLRSITPPYLSNEIYADQTKEHDPMERPVQPSVSNQVIDQRRQRRMKTIQKATVYESRKPCRTASHEARIQQLRRELESLRSQSRKRRTHTPAWPTEDLQSSQLNQPVQHRHTSPRRLVQSHTIQNVGRAHNYDWISNSRMDRGEEHLEDALMKLATATISIPHQTSYDDSLTVPTCFRSSFDGTDPETNYGNSANPGDYAVADRKNEFFESTEINFSTLPPNRTHRDNDDDEYYEPLRKEIEPSLTSRTPQNPNVRSNTLSKLLPDPANSHRLGSRSKRLSELLPELPPKGFHPLPPILQTMVRNDAGDSVRHQPAARKTFQPKLHYGYPKRNDPIEGNHYSLDVVDPALTEAKDSFLPVSSSRRQPVFPLLSNLAEVSINNEATMTQPPPPSVWSSVRDNEGRRSESPTPSEKARRLLAHLDLVQSLSQELKTEQANMKEEMMEFKQRYHGNFNVLNHRAWQIGVVEDKGVTEIIDPEAEHDDRLLQDDDASVDHIQMTQSEDGVIHVATVRDTGDAIDAVLRLEELYESEDDDHDYGHTPSPGEHPSSSVVTTQLQEPPLHFLKPTSSYKSHPPPDIVRPTSFCYNPLYDSTPVRVDDTTQRVTQSYLDTENVADDDDSDGGALNDDGAHYVEEQEGEEIVYHESMVDDDEDADGRSEAYESEEEEEVDDKKEEIELDYSTVDSETEAKYEHDQMHVPEEDGRYYYESVASPTENDVEVEYRQGQADGPEKEEYDDEGDYSETMTDDDDVDGEGHDLKPGSSAGGYPLVEGQSTAKTKSCGTARPKGLWKHDSLDPTHLALRRLPQNLLSSTGSYSSVSTSTHDPSVSRRSWMKMMILGFGGVDDKANSDKADHTADADDDSNRSDYRGKKEDSKNNNNNNNIGGGDEDSTTTASKEVSEKARQPQSAVTAAVLARQKKLMKDRRSRQRKGLRPTVPAPTPPNVVVISSPQTNVDVHRHDKQHKIIDHTKGHNFNIVKHDTDDNNNNVDDEDDDDESDMDYGNADEGGDDGSMTHEGTGTIFPPRGIAHPGNNAYYRNNNNDEGIIPLRVGCLMGGGGGWRTKKTNNKGGVK